jgi:hypothetical protein
MQYREQQKYIDALKFYENKMDPKELYDYKMFVKRQKDDEDLDTISLARLKALHDKYMAAKVKKNYDDFFKKPEQ